MDITESDAEAEKYAMYGENALIIIVYVVGVLLNGPVLILYFRSKYIRSITDKYVVPIHSLLI